jgi:DNA-binding transcriptional LysR family regulator
VVAAALGWPDAAPTLTFETRALAVQAATAGMGAAVVDRNLVAGMLASGILGEITPDPPIAAQEGHWFVALPDRLHLRPVRQFRDWLVGEAMQAHAPPWQHPVISP